MEIQLIKWVSECHLIFPDCSLQNHNNKIGTYNAAVLAKRHKIPFIVVAPISTVDLDIPDGSQYVDMIQNHFLHQSLIPHDSIPIEQRPPIEACLIRGILYPDDGQTKQVQVMFTPPGLDGIYNPSFDVTPAELVTAIVTEKGVAVKAEGETVFDLGPIV